jgi:DNA-binding transcriptional ArsR family regulator
MSNSALARRLPAAATAFAALGDPTRLALVTKLCDGSQRSIAQLTEGEALSRQAISKHLRVLENAHVVRCRRRGRESLYALNPKSIDSIRDYLAQVSRQWDAALARLKSFVED